MINMQKNNNLLITPHIGGATIIIIKTDFFVINEFLKKNNIK